jgi:hypothetical protein
MMKLLTVSGVCLLLCLIFEILFVFVNDGGDAFWIFCLWMIFTTYGIASLCQILMFDPPSGSNSGSLVSVTDTPEPAPTTTSTATTK